MPAEKAILRNQIIIMSAMLSLPLAEFAKSELIDRIAFTKALLRGLV